MKKYGFTLAEVLITLGVVGVVAALTLPSISASTSKAKIGASVAKAFNTMVNINKTIFQRTSAMNLRNVCGNNYPACLSNYMEGAYYTSDGQWIFTTKDGIAFIQPVKERDEQNATPEEELEYARAGNLVDYIGSSTSAVGQNMGTDTLNPIYSEIAYPITIDINGVNKAPNAMGEDRFLFYVDVIGPVVASGSDEYRTLQNADSYYVSSGPGDDSVFGWRNGNCDATGIGNPNMCAGSIVDNGFKVIY